MNDEEYVYEPLQYDETDTDEEILQDLEYFSFAAQTLVEDMKSAMEEAKRRGLLNG